MADMNYSFAVVTKEKILQMLTFLECVVYANLIILFRLLEYSRPCFAYK